MKKRLAGAGIAVVIAITASGCANTIEGHALAKEPPKPALAASVSTESADFDPCFDLSNRALEHAHLRPSTKSNQSDGDVPACLWVSDESWYAVGIFSHDVGLARIESSSDVLVLRRTTVGGRHALVFSYSADPGTDLCLVAFEGGSGSVVVVPYAKDGYAVTRSALCGIALEHAGNLVDAIPTA
ncbi:DUF3558 family protein [Smaragdicoccus niigatensis]|uniref:DUF3558 family protein n=1 Tax=Smaragdicoccus niigatensis TaxID=359359 RepID=UPI00037A080B|nr:DUF3558 family protein [Smaragdicoccus niigatensis]